MTVISTQHPSQAELEREFSSGMEDLPRARQNTWFNCALFVLTMAAILAWTVRRAVTSQIAGEVPPFFWVYGAMLGVLAVMVTLAFLEKIDYPPIDDDLNIAVIVPLYNEDAGVAWRTIKSILTQNRQPNHVVVVNDGSAEAFTHVYRRLHWAACSLAKLHGVQLQWLTTVNQGKRRAQAEAMKVIPRDVTTIVTVDSDSALDYMALEHGMRPFADPKVQSVAGLVLSKNATANVLTRIMDLLFVIQQLTDRSSMSRLGSVLVNSGAVALYRAEILRDHLDAYVNETFMNVHVDFSDDSLLTLYALQRGKTVQHPGVFAFSMMPENVIHHRKQQVRWFRGSFIRSLWRLRHLPVNSFGFWRQLLGWILSLTTLIVSFTLVVFYPVIEHKFQWECALAPVVVGYALAARYFIVQRSDMSFGQQFGIFLLGPVAWVYQMIAIRYFRYYGAVTCRKTGWQTRQGGIAEVTDREPVMA